MSHSPAELTKKEPSKLPGAFNGITGKGMASFQTPTQLSTTATLNETFAFARKEKASDVHLTVGKPIIFRQFGSLKNATTQNLTSAQIQSLMSADLPKEILQRFDATGDIEYVHTIPGYGRFRITIIKQRNGCDLTARVIPLEIPKFEESGMPESCINLTKWAQGMVLVAGPTGCGKTTSLAVLIEMINQNRTDHIITIEEPIEIVYEPKKCQITQREINIHTHTQNNALRAALREDPDILVVSELRDLPTMQLAISAAETGHLLLGTMNTVNAVQTISKLVDSFPAEEQGIIRKMISESLRGIICQKLIPKKDGTGLVAAHEVLTVTQSVANLIREDKVSQIKNVITTGKSFGMIGMDTSIENLVEKGIISVQDAIEHAMDQTLMVQTLTPK